VTTLAALHARITGDASDYVATTNEAGKATDTFVNKVGRSPTQGATGAMGRLKTSLTGLSRSQGARMLPLQLSQVAQQAAAGTPVLNALAIQAADIGLIFGTVGAIAGTLATVAMPVLIGAFSATEEEAETLNERLDGFRAALERGTEAAEIAQTPLHELRKTYGALAEQIQFTARIAAQAAFSDAIREFDAAVDELEPTLGALSGALQEYGKRSEELAIIQRTLGERTLLNASAFDEAEAALDRAAAKLGEVAATMGLSSGEAVRLRAALDKVAGAQGMEAVGVAAGEALEQITGMYDETQNIPPEVAKVIDQLRAMQVEAAKATAQMAALADESERVANAGAGDKPSGKQTDSDDKGGDKGTSDVTPPETGRGGGGRARSQDTFQRDLERLREQLATEIEVEQEMNDARLEMLRQAHENELLTQQEYQDLMEREKKRHAERMAEIDVWQYGTSLDKLETFLGGMATAFASGNERMMQIAKVFGAGEALINAWRTYSQVMADPSLPWYAKLPAALSLFGSAVQAVKAIQGVGKGGSGQRAAGGGAAGGNEAQPVQAEAQRQNRTLTLIGDRFNRQQAIQIAEFMNDGTDDGLRIRGR
jgi:hypothetical protein